MKSEEVHLHDEITNVRMGPIEDGYETFTFKLRGWPYKAVQKGRIRDLCIGHSDVANRKIAAMAIIEGFAISQENKDAEV